ncbi:hypothetical protein [Alteromonas sp. a30]|uniref:hypothetical protein n=1 Tax=Alteromonas sp. a30 TaxID=2730917 RepID=UPI00228136BC|nr:hypothetical protein [Alteromonas sp. a30]MCY7295079.1 hypothetical protein [Alteromonas sp. a30]
MHSLIKMTAILVLSSLSSVTFANGGGIKPNPEPKPQGSEAVWKRDKAVHIFDWVSFPTPNPNATPTTQGGGDGGWPGDKD